MNNLEFDYLKQILYERSGLVVTPEKGYLIESRLSPIARRRGVASVGHLIEEIRRTRDETVLRQVVDAMTTNETLFFRDGWPFERLKNSLLPEVMSMAGSSRRIRIWSAACSSGQEPYSLAMTIAEMGAALAGWQIQIVATDISEAMLARAEAGRYSMFEVSRGLPEHLLSRYFVPEKDGWRVKDSLREMIEFRRYNLLDDPAANSMGPFDIVFCRNVLIYFDEATRKRVFDALARTMRPWGVLCLGGAETVVGISSAFRVLAGERGLFGLAR
ncbi:CheR family methyltransferase [Parvibaculum sp.]|jgi:chemotaxis protein methyltransferase CheR|uniref:CheR family methyltransferase n=1 Tax=Parvibaculum sp. TaxID=2024848 RepID=UPI001B12BB10|nr:CheR family methyltransferase [Parvibaculum sp.]MBO6678267.1 chemotaxis protein CheR [Parvibaculum sp.]MBO6684517.1 chemotaxis protein CheR [Parvibaculum sp.]MBO6904576.1 chemotaxis protein CheR [Parvibaculum sp.]